MDVAHRTKPKLFRNSYTVVYRLEVDFNFNEAFNPPCAFRLRA